MIKEIRSKLTYANVCSSLALFVALGGTSYAAITLPRDSVGSNAILAIRRIVGTGLRADALALP